MFIAFLKSPLYNMCVSCTQRRTPIYLNHFKSDDSGYISDDSVYSDDEESQFKESDYYCVEHHRSDSEYETRCKSCINYTAAILLIASHLFVFYLIIVIYN